jgi:hypothetical protein
MSRISSEEKDYTSLITSLGMSRGIPGYPGGLPRGSAGEAGPVPPRPLPPRETPAEDLKTRVRSGNGSELSRFAQNQRLL